MATCPSCQAEIDPEGDFCLSCGEPLGGAPPLPPARPMPMPGAPPSTSSTPPEARARAVAPPNRPTLPATGRAKRRVEEHEPVRCPGCGSPSRAARCPGCGAVLRRDD